MSRKFNSKSTKRRRFLEEVEIINVYRTNTRPSSTRNNIALSQSTDIFSIKPDNNSVVSNESMDSNPIPTQFNFSSPSLSCVDYEIASPISDSSSNSDEESSQFSYFNDNDLMIKLISQWAVTYNISNTALSALLKSLKLHKCFCTIPIDARTVLKINYNHPM